MSGDRGSMGIGARTSITLAAAALACAAAPVYAQSFVIGDPVLDAPYKAEQARIPAGNAGLEYLIAQGAVRRVSKADINGWAEKGARLKMVAGPFMGIDSQHDPLSDIGGTTSAYLVLKPLTAVPADLAGADSVIFIVPQGVQIPGRARVEHNSFYSIEGYPGIPPAGVPVRLDSRARMIAQVEGPKTDQPRQPHISPIQEERASSGVARTIVLSALALLGLAIATLGILMVRIRKSRAVLPASGPAVAHGPRPSAIAPPEGVGANTGNYEILDQLVTATDLATDPVTALSLVKIRKIIIETMADGDYDDDIAKTLDDIIENGFATALRAYGRAAKTADGTSRQRVENDMRTKVDAIRTKIEALIDEQGERDAQPSQRST